MRKACVKLEKEWGTKAHRIFYMATPPSMFGEIPKYLGKAGLARDREWARIVIEKPIGYDLESARSLNATLAASFEASQIFRIDHAVGKPLKRGLHGKVDRIGLSGTDLTFDHPTGKHPGSRRFVSEWCRCWKIQPVRRGHLFDGEHFGL